MSSLRVQDGGRMRSLLMTCSNTAGGRMSSLSAEDSGRMRCVFGAMCFWCNQVDVGCLSSVEEGGRMSSLCEQDSGRARLFRRLSLRSPHRPFSMFNRVDKWLATTDPSGARFKRRALRNTSPFRTALRLSRWAPRRLHYL